PLFALTNLPAGVSIWLALSVSSTITMFGSGRFIPAMSIVSAVVKPSERGTFMSLENSCRQLAAGGASQIAGIIIGSTASGALTRYNYVGYITIATSILGIVIASKITRKFNLR